MIKIKFNKTVTVYDIKKVIDKYPNDEICIVLNNTKKQSPGYLEDIARVYPNLKFSVLGGLDPGKNKYNNEHYQKRTYYTPLQLSKIIEFFQRIEKKINISWSDTEKVMFIYQEICNNMVYSECNVNGRDCARNLLGLLYGKAVCSGFAMIFKEALDRNNIPNFYQNKTNHHSWNIAYVDGAYRAFELTWDCSQKKGDGCKFLYFNRNPDFYADSHHDIRNESEEVKYNITPYTERQIDNARKIINKPKVINIPLASTKSTSIYIGEKRYIFMNNNGQLSVMGGECVNISRSDGSKFILIHAGKLDGLNKYYYFELVDNTIRGTRIYSEVDFVNLPHSYERDLADGLLSAKRLKRKVNLFNGYVGYIGENHGIYYDSKFEEEKLNIVR